MKTPYEYIRKLILPIDEIDKVIPKSGKVIDFGCGEGLIASFLAKQPQRMVIGLDANKKRLSKYFQKNLVFKRVDITKVSLKKINGAVISDVLHHLPLKDQQKLLEKIFKNLNKNGVLVIKEIDTGEFVRSRLSRIWDLVFYPKDKILFRDAKELKKTLDKLGFKVKIARPMRLFPGSTTLFICRK